VTKAEEITSIMLKLCEIAILDMMWKVWWY